MNPLKFYNIKKIIYIIFLLLFIIHFSLNHSCMLNDSSDLTVYLGGNSNETNEMKKRCFALSYYFNNSLCCYNSNTTECTNTFENETENSGLDCPIEAKIPNNCGLAGIFEPIEKTTCTGISLVQGYCCYTILKNGNNTSYSCLRTKELSKNKNQPSKELLKYVNNINQNIGIEFVECHSFFIKYNSIFNIILIITILFY